MRKIVSRFVPVFVVVAMLAFTSLPALAQDGANPLCSGLSEADCQLMEAGQASLEGVTSFAIPSYSFSFMMNDGTTETSFSATGSAEIMLPVDGDMNSLVLHLMVDEASAVDANGSQSGSIEVIIVNSMAYIQYEGEWYGDTLSEEDLASFGDLSSITDLGALTGGDTSGTDDLGIDLTGVLTTVRGADQDMMGQSVATFTTSINVSQFITALLSSPMIGSLLGDAMGGDAGMEMTPEDMQMLGMFITPMLGNTSLSFVQGVGVNDMMMHAVALDVVFNLDMSSLAPEAGAINGEMHLSTEIANVNETFTVTPPESYKPADELDISELDSLGM